MEERSHGQDKKTRSSLILARVPGGPLALLRNPLKTISSLVVGTVQSQFCRCSNLGSFPGGPRILSLLTLLLETVTLLSLIVSFSLLGNAQGLGLAALQDPCLGSRFLVKLQPSGVPPLLVVGRLRRPVG